MSSREQLSEDVSGNDERREEKTGSTHLSCARRTFHLATVKAARRKHLVRRRRTKEKMIAKVCPVYARGKRT